jgi:competence protein ComEC
LIHSGCNIIFFELWRVSKIDRLRIYVWACAVNDYVSAHILSHRQALIPYWSFFFGLGISFYFYLPFEPLWFISATICLTVFSFFWITRRYFHAHAFAYVIVHVLMAVLLGFSLANSRTAFLNTGFITKPYKDHTFTATVMNVEHTKGVHNRYTLGNINGMPVGEAVSCVRLKGSADLYLEPGWRVSWVATLLPITGSVSPVAYDFKRASYFAGIGANGRLKSCHVLEKPTTSMARLRFSITTYFRDHLTAPYGDIAAALVTGDRSGIPKELRQQFTDAGLAHVLAISGLHLGLVAGIIFFAIRHLLIFGHFFTERIPIRECAAVITIIAMAFYLALSGFGYPAIRSFAMTSLVMVGLVVNRNPISMRSVALAAAVILIVYPESLLSASFQLSFAAVIALIAAYDVCAQPLMDWSRKKPDATDAVSIHAWAYWYRRPVGYFCAIILTTVVATLATTPISMAIFNRLTMQAILGNLIAIPLTGFVIMPMAVLTTVSFIWGGSALAFKGFEYGIRALVETARYVASLPGAGIMVPTPTDWFYVFFVIGGLMLCLGPWRRLRMVGCIAACFSGVFFIDPPLPIGYFAGDRSVFAFYDKPTLYVSSLKRGQFHIDQWRQHLGVYPENIHLMAAQDIVWHGYHVIADPFRNVIDGIYASKESAAQRLKKRYMRSLKEKAPVLTNGYWRRGALVHAEALMQKGSAFVYEDGSLKFMSDAKHQRPWG